MSRDCTESRRRVGRRSALRGLVAGAGAVTLAGRVAAGPGRRARSARCDLVVPDDHATIQGAVDAAAAGDVVCVRDGTYAEQVVVSESLALRSARGASPRIVPPDDPVAFTIAESGPAWEPMVFAYGGTESEGHVSGTGTVTVSLSGFTLDGQGEQPDAPRKPAVLYRNASGTVSNNTVRNVGVGGKATFGVLAYGDSDVVVLDNHVSDYERGGIGANGDGGAHPSPRVRVRNNVVTGSTGLGEAWGPNGIQVGFGASGDVRGNVVRDNRYSADTPVAAGILVFESDGVRVQRNRVMNADVALSCGSWGWFRATADHNQFTGNEVTDAVYGVLLRARADPYGGVLTQTSPAVDNTHVVGNALVDDETTADPEGLVGVAVRADDVVDNEFVPSAANNKVVRNAIRGFETAVDDGGTATKVRPFTP
ncbi:MAG: right-handed parallel beta-helix repeat-containing protein [Halobacteriaceae archaeon]